MQRLKTKICLVGERMVGKTSIIRRYVLNVFDDKYITTLGAKVSKKEVVVEVARGEPLQVNLAIWDFMGQEGFRELLKDAYLTGARGILAVADITRHSTLDALGPWVDTVRSVAGDVPMVLAVNKADLDGHAECTEGDLEAFASRVGCDCMRASAKTGANVEETFRRLAWSIAKQQIDA